MRNQTNIQNSLYIICSHVFFFVALYFSSISSQTTVMSPTLISSTAFRLLLHHFHTPPLSVFIQWVILCMFPQAYGTVPLREQKIRLFCNCQHTNFSQKINIWLSKLTWQRITFGISKLVNLLTTTRKKNRLSLIKLS